MAHLLVSVRSAEEARAAWHGGAAIVDVKEPDRGPLGRADPDVWVQVRAAIPEFVPLSLALGELTEWDDPNLENYGADFHKLGLAGLGTDSGWVDRWSRARRRANRAGWVAVAYADWKRAGAPSPEEILDAAASVEECKGILVDTWDKSRAGLIDLGWTAWFDRARDFGLFTALAGRLDLDAIRGLAPLQPDVIAVRGAACFGGDRRASIDADRVAALAHAAMTI